MTDNNDLPSGTHRGQPDKRRSIIKASATVFGREGYWRANVNQIATEAGVSKKTIYNHFQDKEELFLVTALEGSTALTNIIGALAEKHLGKILDAQDDLISFGVDRAKAIFTADEHSAMARTIRAEVTHIPPHILETWMDTGPLASQRDIAQYFLNMQERGHLTFDDVDKAAAHYTLLSFTPIAERTFFGALPISVDDITDHVKEGVETFLRLYGTH